jgi:hypothetical protein
MRATWSLIEPQLDEMIKLDRVGLVYTVEELKNNFAFLCPMYGKTLLVLLLVGTVCPTGLAQVEFTSSNLPIIVLNTHAQTIGEDLPIVIDMGVIDNGAGNSNLLSDPFNVYQGKVAIVNQEVFSSSYPKKQYEIQLRNADGNGIEASLLGMPAESEWILVAAYHDKSLMRDGLGYWLNRQTGKYAPRFQFCEVILNDEYIGVYVLTEKIKRGSNRINIQAAGATGNNLTGGYIIKIDRESTQANDGWRSTFQPPNGSGDQTIFFRYVSPGASEISNPQREYIRQFLTDFETALAAPNFTNPGQGYARLIDMDSFIDYLLVSEVTKNPEAYRLNTYLYKVRQSSGNRLFMGPGWNYGIAFGNGETCLDNSPMGHVLDFNLECPNDFSLVPFWWNRFLDDISFRQRLEARWAVARNGVYSTSTIQAYVDSVAHVLNQGAQQRNFIRWPVLGDENYQQQITQLKQWITARLEWLDVKIPRLITSTELEPHQIVSIYPNPFQHAIRVSFKTDRPGTVNLRLVDMQGNLVTESSLHVEIPGNFEHELITRTLPPGLYCLQYQENSQLFIRKVIKVE